MPNFNITKGAAVVIMAEGHSQYGKEGVVTRTTRNKKDLRMTRDVYVLVNGTESPYCLQLQDVKSVLWLTPDLRRTIAVRAIEIAQARQESEDQRFAERRKLALVSYAQERAKHIALMQLPAALRQSSPDGDRIEFDAFHSMPEQFRSSMTIYNREHSEYRGGLPDVTVSWSAYGACSPDEALRFAKVLNEAALEAMKLLHEREAKDPAIDDAIGAAFTDLQRAAR